MQNTVEKRVNHNTLYQKFWKHVFIAIILSTLAIIGVLLPMAEAEQQIINEIANCLEKTTQCGLHNIIDELEIEDASIKLAIESLQQGNLQISDEDKDKGLRVAKYLLNQPMDTRERIIQKATSQYRR